MAAVSSSRSTPVTSPITVPQQARHASVGDIAPVYRPGAPINLSFGDSVCPARLLDLDRDPR